APRPRRGGRSTPGLPLAPAARPRVARRPVQFDRPGGNQRPVLAEEFDPQLVAAGGSVTPSAPAPVPVVGVEVIALEEAIAGERDHDPAPRLDDLHDAVVGAGRAEADADVVVA